MLDVVVPTYNNLDELKRCLASLEAQTARDFRVLVCVDGSTDGTIDFLSTVTFRVPVRTLTHLENLHRGRAATRNLALGHVESEYVVFLDSDMELMPHGLTAHQSLLAAEPSASVGSIKYRNTETNVWARYLSVRRLNRWPAGSRLPFNQFATTNVAMHTADFVALHGFDEQLAGYGGEDADLGYRLDTELGRPIFANHTAMATAFEAKQLETAMADFRAFGRANLHYLHAKHPEMPHTFFTDRLRSRKLRDRIFTAMMNPVSDRIADALLPVAPFAIQELLVNYKLIREVSRGFIEGAGTVAHESSS